MLILNPSASILYILAVRTTELEITPAKFSLRNHLVQLAPAGKAEGSL